MPQYVALIHKDPDSDYGVSFPDLPGCVTAGSSLDEARTLAEEALSFHLDGLTQDGDAVPEPSSLDAIMSDIDNRSGVAILVAAPGRSPRSVSIDVTFPEEMLGDIDRYAQSQGLTRSGFLARAAKRLIEAG